MNPKHELEKILPKERIGTPIEYTNGHNAHRSASLTALCKRTITVAELEDILAENGMIRSEAFEMAGALTKSFIVLRREGV